MYNGRINLKLDLLKNIIKAGDDWAARKVNQQTAKGSE